MTREQIHSAEKVAYSSIVGQSIMLLNEAGACIGQLSVINTEHPQHMADQVVAALKAPNRHAYKVGVAVGKVSGPEQKQGLNDLADLGQEFDKADAILDVMPAPVWQPIETAPKDGTRFLAFEQSGDYCISECWWQRDWQEWSGWQNDWDNEPNPTHWMPLPAPPDSNMQKMHNAPTPHPEQPEPIREALDKAANEAIWGHVERTDRYAAGYRNGVFKMKEAALRALEGGA